MSTEIRPYRKARRAELEDETRRRITESTVALHGTIGPSRTTISAVAELAGVRRSTVYRHFPDEESLFAACTAHWNAANPPPALDRWAAVEDPLARLEEALTELYGFYRRAEPMLANLLRDESVMPVVQQSFRPFRGFLEEAGRVLLVGWPRRKRVRAAVGHALAFSTWRSLAREQGLDDAQAAALMGHLVESA